MSRADPRRSGRAEAAVPYALVLAVFACFLPVLSNGFLLWDDDLNLTENPLYRGLGPAQLGWIVTTRLGGHYQPLTWLSFALDYTLWGMDAAGYHLTSLVLHAVNTLLVFRLVGRLIPWAGVGPRLAGALLFGLHPLRVEAVAWATARRDVLGALFYLLTLLTYLRYAVTRDGGDRAWPWLAASLGCFALSMLAKAQGMTLPLVLLVLDLYPLRRFARGFSAGTLLAEKLPFVLLSLAAAVTASFGLGEARTLTLTEYSVARRVAQAAHGLVFYLWKTAVPGRLSPLYLLETTLDPWTLRYVLAALFVVAVTAALVVLRRRAPWALAAWVCYAAILAPVLGFAQTGPQTVADRYSYLACLPWVVLAAAGLARLHGPLPAVLTAATLVALGLLTFRQTHVWHDTVTLWDQALRLDPTNHIALNNRGMARLAAGEAEGALADFTAALAASPPPWRRPMIEGNIELAQDALAERARRRPAPPR